KTCTNGSLGVCDPPPKTTCAPNSITACTTCSTLSQFSSGTHICNSNCDYAGAYCTPTGGSWTANSVDSVFQHECGSKYTQTGMPDVWMVFPSSGSACWMQKGPNFKLPRGRYKWTFKVTINSSNGGLSADVARNGTTVGPPDGPQPDFTCPWNGPGYCPPGVITITKSEADVTQVYSIDFGVPDDCGASYELRVRAYGPGGWMMLHYSTVSWAGTY
ncbi:MAG: hypothetical protein Q8N51_18290, partial [Gammaproteobacteria bacterium]|nr:hypothetical protein [Gammaproteobacteria bacterium]